MEYIIHFSQISRSQEDLLRQTPFVNENEMPTENSSLPSSPGRRLDHCAVGQVSGFDEEVFGFSYLLDSEGTEYVDLDRDSDLGFAEMQLNQRATGESVAESSRSLGRDAVDDEFRVFERPFCSQSQNSICEFSVKSSELKKQKLGFDSSRRCLGVDSQKVEEGNGDWNGKRKRGSGAESPCNVISMLKNMGSRLEEEGQGKENYSDFDALKFLQENYESDDDLENAASELESVQEAQRKKKTSAFDALRFLKESEDSLENVNLLEDFKLSGVTLPRPRWWRDTDFFRKQRLA